MERLAGYTYPVVTINRWKPTVEYRQLQRPYPQYTDVAIARRP